jgi:Gas vesicle synthesis protein GvpL/GvpF
VSSALELFGVALLDGGDLGLQRDGIEVVSVRDLGALVTPTSYHRMEPEDRDFERHAGVLEGVAKHHPVAPAPVGAVFKGRDTIVRWLELHYHALHEALTFLDGRMVTRVHLVRRETKLPGIGSDLAAAAADVFKMLRMQAAAVVPLKTEYLTGIVLSGAFLVERERLDSFTSAVAEAAQSHHELDVQLTGPWPPYDFVRLDLGG